MGTFLSSGDVPSVSPVFDTFRTHFILFSLYLSVGEFFIMDNITWYIIIWGIVVFEKRKYALFFVIDEKFIRVKDLWNFYLKFC